MNATNTTKYENTGVIILVADDASLNNAPVNSGVIFDFINNGINVGAKYVHFVDIVFLSLQTILILMIDSLLD